MMVRIIFLLAFGAMLVFGCDDIFVKNISSGIVILSAPADSVTVNASTTSKFLWESLEGAESYELRIAFPTVAQSQNILLDTTVSTTSLPYKLPKGTYQWCVRASNSGYTTSYSCRVIKVVD